MLGKNPFKSNIVKAYWWKEVANFGDGLAPFLLEHFSGIKVEWDTVSRSQVASIGSILEHIPPLWEGYILGSGMLHENSRLQIHQMNSGITAKILAVRGPFDRPRSPRHLRARRPRHSCRRVGRSAGEALGLGHPAALHGHGTCPEVRATYQVAAHRQSYQSRRPSSFGCRADWTVPQARDVIAARHDRGRCFRYAASRRNGDCESSRRRGL